MELANLLVFLFIGATAGWLISTLKKEGGFRVIVNLIIGIVGAFIGGLVFALTDLAAIGFIGSALMATVGALLLLYIGDVMQKPDP
ncbi:GlsB/YeaQ/YmgE family stress response membrane protein [Oceanobacter sp. 4_MG-2023]|uniref:GlsB/YeaQ/YmgE family stress response membrane protein n=1 Tax=Oceanobacter sp. 4_MG-2023 TaxID=3062623 RepID=UPI002733F7EF|nr:GlsB/YeaQ/YmgE family stress response membrane protein [Oceanobacter sp. 4_MG-2023]MDP2547103.1 GlsB/YeaQ/YmgE family stress response membrane protein [Oceanobacter sp. 4_MG-2023]